MNLKKFHFHICLLLLSCCFYTVEAVDHLPIRAPKWDQLTLNYTQNDLQYLKQEPKPNQKVTYQELIDLTKEVTYLIDSNELSDIDLTIIPAYLANAQKDFVWLTYLLTGEPTGNLGPITLWTLQLFIPNISINSLNQRDFDVYTSALSSLIVGKYSTRLQQERAQTKNYPIKKGEGLWTHTSPGYTGLNFGSAKTWFLNSSNELVADVPPKDLSTWEKQCDLIKGEQLHLSGDKVMDVYKWAGLTSVNAGNFEQLLYRYLDKKNLSLLDYLYVRSLYLSALADSNAAAFNSKYTYWVKRPTQMDSAINPLVQVPNHPSYPSAHSTISSTACTIISALFPNDSAQWDQIAKEAGLSRIWGGIHYPVDHSSGKTLGEKVGEIALQRTY